MTQSKTKSWLPNLVFCSSSHFMNQCCCTDVKEKQNLRTYLFDVEWEVLKTFDGVKSWPVQMQIKTRNINFVFDFWFLFLLTFYGDILAYGCEKKQNLRTYLFDVKWEVLKTFGVLGKWLVQMHTKSKNKNFVFNFLFLFFCPFWSFLNKYCRPDVKKKQNSRTFFAMKLEILYTICLGIRTCLWHSVNYIRSITIP